MLCPSFSNSDSVDTVYGWIILKWEKYLNDTR